MPKKTYTISKSRYIRGLLCHKSLWLYTYQSKLRVESKIATRSFEQGHKVGDLARDIFPGGVLIPFEGAPLDEQVSMTVKAMKTAKVIYEAAFCHDGVFVKADIMRKILYNRGSDGLART